MKAVIIRRSGKLIVAALGCAIIVIAAATGGPLGGGYDNTATVLNDGLVRDLPSARPLRVLVPAGALYAPAIVANAGAGQHDGTLFGKNHGVSIEFEVEEDFDVCLKRFASGEADIIWAGADTFAWAYPRIRSVNPVAFLLCGYSRGDDLVVARKAPLSPDDYRGATIACAANTPSHFMALYLLSLAGVKPSEAAWSFTRTPADAARLFARGRADICAAPGYALAPVLDGKKEIAVISSTGEASRLVAGLFIARESTLLVRREQVSGFIRAWFDGLASLLHDTEAAAALLARQLGTDTARAHAEIGRYAFAGYAENRRFFLIDDSEWGGFPYLFDRAYTLYHGETAEDPAVSGYTRNTDLLVALEGELKSIPSPARDKPAPPVSGGAALAGKHSFHFPENRSVPDFVSRGRLARFAGEAQVFPGCAIALYGGEDTGEDRWRDLPGQRLREVARLLVYEHRIPASRIIISNHRVTGVDVKAETMRRVDAVLVAPRRER